MGREIKFSKNWNGKLDSPMFTTIRGFSKEKLRYYQDSKGLVFNITKNGESKGQARLVSANDYPLSLLETELLALDTGQAKREDQLKVFQSFNISESDKVIVLLLIRVVNWGK